MPNADPHMQIARKLRAIEAAKIEMVEQVADVFRGIQSGNNRDLSGAIGQLIGLAYFLGTQVGISPEVIDREVENGLPKVVSHETLDVNELEALRRYLSSKR